MSELLTPFHPGELHIQERAGVRDLLAPVIHRFIRDHMPQQHMDFYAQLPFLMLGSVDEAGQVWAHMATGAPGFVQATDPYHLHIHAKPPYMRLEVGRDVGVLGIELETRRRNRLHGVISEITDDGFTIKVRQTFGNCPKYIQRRDLRPVTASGMGDVEHLTHFDTDLAALLARADTFFIASAYQGDGAAAAQGVDVSHRGGKPGFIRQVSDNAFLVPDFAGNNFFNTLGNLLANPKGGVFVPDFETRDAVYMTGVGEVIFDGPDVEAFKGAQRLLKFTAHQIIRVRATLPFEADFGDYSPMLDRLGSW